MKTRKKFITENTKINIDENAFKANAEELICDLFIEFVNNMYERPVLEKRISLGTKLAH
ncbi:hypothetical protein ACE38V_12825 [Cytobacillus sp. Hz8]|uniref:hypothetical protein n=1 Tax=Cytobacillus sp. Hz8 TaxID=3347168 RepID=UPI0035DC5881